MGLQIDAFGHIFDPDAPETVRCTACDGTAEYLSSAWQGEGSAYHNYQCRAEECPAGGAIVEREREHDRRVGPVFHAPRSHHPTRRADHPAGSRVRGDDASEREQPPAREVRA